MKVDIIPAAGSNADMETRYILKVAADGRVEREEFDAADSLGQLQRAVGGYIERVPVQMNGLDLFVDDEGLPKGLPENRVLTAYVRPRRGGGMTLVGDGVFAAHDGEGETMGIGADDCDLLEMALCHVGGTVERKEA